MKLAGQADAEHPVFVDGAPGCGQDAGHAARHQVARGPIWCRASAGLQYDRHSTIFL